MAMRPLQPASSTANSCNPPRIALEVDFKLEKQGNHLLNAHLPTTSNAEFYVRHETKERAGLETAVGCEDLP